MRRVIQGGDALAGRRRLLARALASLPAALLATRSFGVDEQPPLATRLAELAREHGVCAAAFAVVSLVALGFCVLRARADLDDRLAPMAGLVAAFIFAVQMLNFQVLPGVSGHLLGGALAATLAGPWVGALCVATVLVVQCLLFADGGLTALGLNVFNMAILGTAVGYLVVAGLLGGGVAAAVLGCVAVIKEFGWGRWVGAAAGIAGIVIAVAGYSKLPQSGGAAPAPEKAAEEKPAAEPPAEATPAASGEKSALLDMNDSPFEDAHS